MRTPIRRWVAVLATLAASTATLGTLGAVAGPAPAHAEDAAEPGLLAWWKLDETGGTVATDSSGNGHHGTVQGTASWAAGDGFAFSGGANSGGNAIELPDNLLAGVDDVTVDFDVWVDPALSGNNFVFNLGNPATWPNGTGYLFVTDRDSSGRLRATIAENGGGNGGEQSVMRNGGLQRGVWKHVTYVVDGGTPAAPGSARLYEDGALVASSNSITTSPALMGEPNGATTHNFLGRSAYAGDRSFQGRLRDFRIYSRALTGAEAEQRAATTVTPVVETDTAALTLGDTSAVVADLALPARGASATTTVSWASSAPGVVSPTGAVTRPAFGQEPATATLTATVVRGGVSRTKEFQVTVLPEELDDAGKAQEAVAAVELVQPDDVRGNITLPTRGLHDTTLAWASSHPDIVTPTGEVTRPAHGQSAVDVSLTVTATKGTATASRDIVVRVQPMPAPKDYDAYAFAYFAGESTPTGEQIYFAASDGDDPLDYDELNDGAPVLASTHGTQGLRDPFLIRSHEGDRFWLLATDLKAYPQVDFGEAQETGSKYIEVWESTDLVHWSEQRHIKVSSDFAGNTWAPEAFYDEQAGEYVVYWASALYPTTDTAGRDIGTSYQRMMYATTRDFVTFSEPKVWVDVRRGAGRGMIDATVVKDGDTYYRVIKDEASMTPRQERSTDLRATVSGTLPTTTSTPGWQLVRERVGVGQPNPWGGTFSQGEGPTVFRDNDDPDRWYMFIDQPSYHGGRGYLAFRTDDIDSGDWTSIPTAELPSSPRHGTVIPVTQAELDALRAGLQPNLLVTGVDDVAVRTREGVAPNLPTTVAATFGDGTSGQVEVEWEPVDPASYATPGSFTVTGTVVSGAADRPLATVTVTDSDDPVVTLASAPDGAAGWWVTDPARATATATDATAVARVETSVDGGAWTATDGGQATVEVTGDGVHEVRARAVDTTGNESATQATTVRIDTEAPVTRATYAGRTVTVRAADATSGVARVEYRLHGGAWTPYDGGFAVPDSGATVEYRGVDRAGNEEATNELLVPSVDDALRRATVVAVTEDDTVPFGTALPVTVRVAGDGGTPTGVVRVVAGDRVLASANLADGRARVVVDTADLERVGRHELVVRYDGDGVFRHDEDRVALTVTKARSRTSLGVADRGRDGRDATARVRVTTEPGGLEPGRVRLVLRRAGEQVARWVTLRDGTGRLALPRLDRGAWTAVATTGATAVLQGSEGRVRFYVR